MYILKTVLFLLALIQFNVSTAQDYGFIPSEQHLLTDEEIKTTQIVITPDVELFSEYGTLLPTSQMELMTNSDYTPLFYANKSGKIKSVIFRKNSNSPILILKNPEAHFESGEKALDFIVSDLEGNTTKLTELKGKVVVLNFWFTKCGPCVMEMPDLNNLVEQFKGKDVEFLSITFDKKELVEQFLDTHEFNYRIAPNANDVITMYGVQSYPTNIVINQKGEIVLKELGYRTNIKSVLSQSIKSLLDQSYD